MAIRPKLNAMFRTPVPRSASERAKTRGIERNWRTRRRQRQLTPCFFLLWTEIIIAHRGYDGEQENAHPAGADYSLLRFRDQTVPHPKSVTGDQLAAGPPKDRGSAPNQNLEALHQ